MEKSQFLWLLKITSKASYSIPVLDAYVLQDNAVFALNKKTLKWEEEKADTLEVLAQIYRETLLLQRLGISVEHPCFFFTGNKRRKVSLNELELIVTNGIFPSGLDLIQLPKPCHSNEFEYVYKNDREKKSAVMKKAARVARDLAGAITKETGKEVVSFEVKFATDKRDVWICNLKKVVLGNKVSITPVKKVERRTLSHKISHKQLRKSMRKSTLESLSRINSGIISYRIKKKDDKNASLKSFVNSAVAAKQLLAVQVDKTDKKGKLFHS